MKDQKSFKPDRTRYEIEELLGEGLNSKVYRAQRIDATGLSRQRVALKFLKDQTDVSFLRREFDTLARVRSPYCARMIAWETQNNEPVLALEWIDGITLYELAQTYSLESDENDEIIRQTHLGLRDLRDAGLCHGDLQPKNVMIDREGMIRLIDFANGRTANNELQATTAFAAPEVWADGTLSFEADLFALGVIRKNLPTGFRDIEARTRPSRGDSLLQASPSDRALRVLRENPGARARLAAYVDQSLSKRNSISTQVIRRGPATSKRRPFFARSAIALASSLFIGVTVPVLADVDPVSHDSATAGVRFASEHWMQIAVNGRDAGFAPLTLSRLHAGPHRIAWRTAIAAGEIKIVLNANSNVSFIETNGGTLKVR